MPSFLHLRYSGKIKQVKWPLDPNTALQAIANTFGIKPETIVGFKDKEGKIHSLQDLFNNPDEAHKQSFMLVVQDDSKKNQSVSPTRDARNLGSINEKPVGNQSQGLDLMLISNFAEFERTFLQGSQNAVSIIFVLSHKQQLNEIAPRAESLINQYSNRFDFYCHLQNVQEEDLNIISNAFPLVLVYNGSRRLMEVPLGLNQRNLTNLLDRLQGTDSSNVQRETRGAERSHSQDNGSQRSNVNRLEQAFEQGDLTELEYYFLKSSILEGKNEVITAFTRYSKTHDVDQLKQEIRDLTYREATFRDTRVSGQNSTKHVKSASQSLKQNYVRPETSDGYVKSRNKEMSSLQEKLIQITAELERRSLLTEHSASLIKSLILEENTEVANVMIAYEKGHFDERELSFRLSKLAEKLSPYIVRPSSPLPRKDELLKLVNNLVRKRLKDESYLILLNKLINEGDELLYSTFDVFESDRDEEDLLDTLIRIVNKYKRQGRFGSSLYASPFYSSQKIPLVDNEQELHKERKSISTERPSSQGGPSYFLESRSKSRKGTREHSLIDKEPTGRKDLVSPIIPDRPLDLEEAFKNTVVVKSLPADDYGMIFWLIKNKEALVKDVVNDHGGVDNIDGAIPSLLHLTNKELTTSLKSKLDERQRNYINDSKKVKNSATYAAFQCFKYDHDLDGLVKSLEEIARNVVKPEHKTPTRSHGKSFEAKEHAVSGSQHLQDLAVIREEDKTSQTKHSGYERESNVATASVSSIVESQSQILKSNTPPAGTENRRASKYAPLLTRDQRADSFKGMFQLKLISSDNPAVNSASKEANKMDSANAKQQPEVHESEGTKNSLDAHLNVIIPPKNEINPFTQTFINKFYENQGGYLDNVEKFKAMLAKMRWLTSEDISKLEYLYENFYYELFEVIYTYEINRDLKEFERRLREDILTVDLDNISLASASPRERKRMTTYHSFKALLQNLQNDKSISDKQYKTYLYLYTEEDVTILAAYEVYQYTRDIHDFIDTLLSIEKVQFFKNESKYFEDISNFNDYIEYQLKVIFSLKRYLTLETRATLEKIIRSGDLTVMQIYQEYKRDRDSKNKNNLIHKLLNFAEENIEVVKNYEKSIAQSKLNSEHKNVRRKEQIENFECTKLLPEVKYFDILYNSIENDEELIHSIFEVFDYTKDKIDFIENITLVYKFLYKRDAINVLKRNKGKMHVSDSMIDFVENMIKRNESAIMGPIELYYATKDEQEFVETVTLLIQAKKKRRASNDIKVITY